MPIRRTLPLAGEAARLLAVRAARIQARGRIMPKENEAGRTRDSLEDAWQSRVARPASGERVLHEPVRALGGVCVTGDAREIGLFLWPSPVGVSGVNRRKRVPFPVQIRVDMGKLPPIRANSMLRRGF